MKNTELKKIQREKEQLVFSSILAIVTGFLVSIYSNIIYDFSFKNESLRLNSTSISFLLFSTIITEAFFEFYLKDKYSDGPYTKAFWRRFFDFTFNEHLAFKFLGKVGDFFISIFKLFFWIIFIFSAIQSKFYVLLVLVVLFFVIKVFYRMSKKIK